MAREIVHIPARSIHSTRSAPRLSKLRVAAYCRVSTEQDEQLNSFENQVSYYTEYINNHPRYELAGIYADEGISGTSTRRREQFNRMIADCEAGQIDLVITKSISRFARNTQDCLNYSRKLKDLGIGIIFEKENINTMESTGELLFTILSSLAQEESRSISENSQWGIRSLFKQGVLHLNTNHFLGYDKDENGNLVINQEQAKVVRYIFDMFLDGYSPSVIATKLNQQNIPGCTGEVNWFTDTVIRVLVNEKHMGDAMLQKTYTTDFLTKKQAKNEGQVAQYYIKNNHEPIVSREVWEIAQLELQRRDQYRKEHGLRSLGRYTDEQPFSNRVFCGKCGKLYWRRTFKRLHGDRKCWMCASSCNGKYSNGCGNKPHPEEDLHMAFVNAWNVILENRERYMEKWMSQSNDENLLVAFRAKQFMKLTEDSTPMAELDLAVVRKTLDHCIIQPVGVIEFYFLDGSRVDVCIGD